MKIETKKTREKIFETESCFLNANKIDKCLAKGKETQINEIRDERRDITTDNTEIRIIRNYNQ